MKVNSIFTSIDGEINAWYQGRISTFVRLQGCNLRCEYCDTLYAQDYSPFVYTPTPYQVFDILEKTGCKNVTITGGEPLLQKSELKILLDLLVENRYQISVETNGTISPIKGYEPVVSYVVDYKCPSAGKQAISAMDDSLFLDLTAFDFIKFVIGNELDYEFAKMKFLQLLSKDCEAVFAMSLHGKEVMHKDLVNWLIRDRLFDVAVNVQIHKLIGVQ